MPPALSPSHDDARHSTFFPPPLFSQVFLPLDDAFAFEGTVRSRRYNAQLVQSSQPALLPFVNRIDRLATLCSPDILAPAWSCPES